MLACSRVASVPLALSLPLYRHISWLLCWCAVWATALTLGGPVLVPAQAQEQSQQVSSAWSSSSASSPSSSSSSVSVSASADYVIMIDAGSSGSRIHVHSYTHNFFSSSSSLLPVISASTNKKVKPGLSSYAKKPQQVVSVVSDLLAFAKAAVPMHKWKTTPFHIQATAGLRALPDHEAHEILEIVRNEIQKSPFLFQRSWARIIPGSDEGLNGWLATNYLKGVWDNTQEQEQEQKQEHQQQAPATTGVVEMGGASIQVTYVPKHVSEEERKLLYPMIIAGYEYFVYTYSYLSYGLQAAESAFQKHAIVDIEQDGNPCYPTGLRHSATGSFDRCLSLVSRHLFDKDATCTHHSCSFNGIYQPIFSADDNFLAIENFYYTTQFFGVKTDLSERHLISVLREKGSEYCGLPWKAIKSQHANTPEQELSSYCFATAYEHSMLSHALGFSRTSHIQAIREINGKPIDWELGAVLRELLRYQRMGAKYGSSPESEYNPDLPASERERTRVEQRVDQRLGVSLFDGGMWSPVSSWSLWSFPGLSILLLLILALIIATRINQRNRNRCLPDQALVNLGYVPAPKAAQHVV